MQRQLIGFGVVTLLGVGGLYVAYPEAGKTSVVEQQGAVPEPLTATATAADTAAAAQAEPEQNAPAPAPPPVSIPVIAPAPLDVPEATTDFSEVAAIAACKARPIQEVSRVETSIYRWTDASGQVHFSDRKPAAGSAEVYNSGRSGLDYFDLAINYRGQNIVPFLHDQLSAQATSIYKILTSFVGSEQLKHVQLNIVMFPDTESFHRYAEATTGLTNPNVGGFYSTLTNEAVTFTYPDDRRTMEVAKHEATHVIAMGILGSMPMWLNEGLAEYFSKLNVRSQFSQVPVHDDWLPLARATMTSGYPQRFAEFLKLTPETWRAANEENHYALAWSLVYYMMGTEAGQQTLAKLMLQMAENYCQPIDSAEALARSYPGGLHALEKELYTWLMDDAVKAPHTY